MRAGLVVLAGVALLVGVATQPASAGKGTDIEQFIKRIGKFAILEGDILGSKTRSLCVCQDGGANDRAIGVIAYSGQLGSSEVTVWCWVRIFAPDGTNSVAHGCAPFEVLSK